MAHLPDGFPESATPEQGEAWFQGEFPGTRIVGIDEVGRGPLAGPVVAAAVVLEPSRSIPGLNDSKKLSAAKRELLSGEIRSHAHCWAIGMASAAEIDQWNILGATFLAMRRALGGIGLKADGVLPANAPCGGEVLKSGEASVLAIDGNQNVRGIVGVRQQAIVKGDGRVSSIAAASILAKVFRDKWMEDLDLRYPGYGFAVHAGYPVPRHLSAIRSLGLCPEHRRSFHPKALEQAELPFT